MTMRLRSSLAALALTAALASGRPAAALDGRVVDAASGAAIPGATVTMGDRVATSDAKGLFHIADQGDAVRVRAPGHAAATVPLGDAARRQGELRLAPFQPKGLYLSAWGIGSRVLRNDALALIREGSFNALVITIKDDRGIVDYPSGVALAESVGARRITTIRDLAELVRSLHESNIYAIARIVVFKDEPLATARPDLAVKLANGRVYHDREGLPWTDPRLSEVHDYNIAIAVEAARAGFDEVQFDYLRFPDAPRGIQFADPTTEAVRLGAITGFLAEARRRLAPYNVSLAADVFGYICWNLDDTGIGQRLEEVMPLVDYMSPMLYPSGFQFGIPGYGNPVAHPYEIVRLSLEKARARLLVSPLRFRPWLQAFRDYAFDRRPYGEGEIRAQIRAAGDAGSDGWMLWNPRNVYIPILPKVSALPPSAQDVGPP